MQTNAVLRKRAFLLYWQRRGMLWTIFFSFALVNFLWYAVQAYVIGNQLMETIYQLAVTPVMILGLYHLLLRLTRGREARWPMLFDFVRSPKVVRKALAVGLIWQFPSFLAYLLGLFGMPVIHSRELAILVLVEMLVAGLLTAWITLRLFLLPYLFVLNPQGSVPEMIKSSFRSMKGKVGRLLWFGITVYWWALVLFAVVIVLTPSLFVANAFETNQLVRQLIVLPLIAILNPYFSLAMADYANELLHSARDGR